MPGWLLLAGRLPSRARGGAKPPLAAAWAGGDARCPVRWPPVVAAARNAISSLALQTPREDRGLLKPARREMSSGSFSAYAGQRLRLTFRWPGVLDEEHRENEDTTAAPLCGPLSDLKPGDFVIVECASCGHHGLIHPAALPSLRLVPNERIVDLAPRLRCRECDQKGKAVISI
jgi:hypothetical protein